MTAFIWRIDPLMVNQKVDGLENVVVKITWICEYTDGELHESTSGYVPIELDSDSRFTPFNELTEAIVWEWIGTHINKDIIENGLATIVEGRKHSQYIYMPIPWGKS